MIVAGKLARQRFSFLLKFGPFCHCQIRGLGFGSSVLQAFDEGSAFFWGHFAQRLSLEGMRIRATWHSPWIAQVKILMLQSELRLNPVIRSLGDKITSVKFCDFCAQRTPPTIIPPIQPQP